MPHYGGRKIATLRLTHDATFGTLRELVPDAYECEGFAYYDEQVTVGNDKAAQKLKRGLGLPDGMTLNKFLDVSYASRPCWIVRFELESRSTELGNERSRA